MKLKNNKKGTSLVEYALIATIIFLCSVNVINRFHNKIISKTTSLSDDFPDN